MDFDILSSRNAYQESLHVDFPALLSFRIRLVARRSCFASDVRCCTTQNQRINFANPVC